MKIEDNGKNNQIILPPNIKNVDIQIEGSNNIIEIEDNVTIFKVLYINISDNNCVIKIGKNTSIYELKILVNEDNNKVEIGEDCMISENVKILASDSHSIILTETKKCINVHKRGVKIGNHVWLGMDSLILKDSQIGDNSIIAAGAVVTNKDGKRNVILGGNPAKVIKTKVTWERKVPQRTETSVAEKIEGEPSQGIVNCYIENVSKDRDILKQISGWTYVDNIEDENSEIYFEIENKSKAETYKAQINERADIAKIYGDKYKNSGFNIIFSKGLKLKKIKNINIIIKNAKKIYKAKVLI